MTYLLCFLFIQCHFPMFCPVSVGAVRKKKVRVVFSTWINTLFLYLIENSEGHCYFFLNRHLNALPVCCLILKVNT